VDHGAASVQNLGVRLSEDTLFSIPFASFNVHTNNMDSIFRSSNTLAIVRHIVNDLEVVTEGIDGDGVLSGVILHSTGQETMGEEELVNPEAVWDTAVDPLVEEFKSFLKILDVTSERLERRETLAEPHCGDLTVSHGDHGVFEVVRHKDFSNNSTLHVLETSLDGLDQKVESGQLLSEHSVHGLVVIDGVVFFSLSDIELSWDISDNAISQSDDDGFLVSVSTTTTSLHGGEDSTESIVGLVNFLGNGSIGMHSKYFRLRELRERSAVLEVFLVVASGSNFRRVVSARRTELVAINEGLIADIGLEEAHEGDTILSISDSTTIVTLTNTVVNGIEGSLIGVLVHEDGELLGGNT